MSLTPPRSTPLPLMTEAPDAAFPGRERFALCIPPGDDRQRLVCGDCGWVHYHNPKIIVGAVVTWGEQYLLCRRAIAPRQGFWTIPAGYMEEHETAAAGAAREAWEEARARVEIGSLLAVYSISPISQVQLIYRATLNEPVFAAGPESLEVRLFDWVDIPWSELAFPAVHWALEQHRKVHGLSVFAPFGAGDLEFLADHAHPQQQEPGSAS